MSIGIWQILIVVVLVFLLFGARRFPSVMEDLAKGIKSFKKGIADESDSPSKISDQASNKSEEKEK